jgi:hypothetical protein
VPPVESAAGFLRRYTLDTLARIEEFRARARPEREARVLHGDARELELGGRSTGAHLAAVSGPDRLPRAAPLRVRAARLDDRASGRSAPPASGTSLAPLEAYRAASPRPRAAPSRSARRAVLVVVNDRRDLYPEILERAGLALEARSARHVNRRTGRRAGEYFEDVLVARAS